ncbi:MAG TPA: alkaline phosphatase family protein, partial [Solirubrobacteraceae bacterium]
MRRWSRVSLWLLPVLLLTVGGWFAVLNPSPALPSAQPCSPPHPPARRASPCLTIGAARNPSVAGQVVTIAGRLYGEHHGHRLVLLWRRVPGARRFRLTRATRTDRYGRYSIAGRIESNRWWYVTARGFHSRTVYERVGAVVTLASSEVRAAPGDSVAYTGMVTPSHPGEQVILEQLGSGGWQPVGKGTLDRYSSYSITYALTNSGTYQLRVHFPADRNNISSYAPPVTVTVNPIFKIKHVVIIMQENRSFDQYFGTYPGADGIPGVAGNPGTVPCVRDPVNGGCVMPFHDTNDKNYGGPHGQTNATADMDCTNFAARAGCKMDGFVAQAENGQKCTSTDPNCSPCITGTKAQCIDVMGYHDGADIPNYWAYARNFVLQDHMYEPNSSWSLPEHLFQVSEWSAFCTNPDNPFSCTNALQNPNASDGAIHYAWTDMTYLLHRAGVSWGYYVFQGAEPDCEHDTAMTCAPVQQ